MKWSMILLLASMLSVAACKSDTTKPDMANPASKHCIETGGKLRIVTSPNGGEHGICTLRSGTSCDEWAYFRGECPEPCLRNPGPQRCPMLAPPHPNFCKGGERFGMMDSCGCTTPACDMTPKN